VPTEVLATPRAEQQIGRLSRKHSKAFESFLNDLAAGGCKALAYRLSGQAPADHICVKHLVGSLRVVVAFETPLRAWILLVGPHDDQDPILNVYAELYRLLGAEPEPDAGRDKPPCCDEIEDLPPVLGDAVVEILDRAVKLRKTRQSR
jgi:mRNA-degrading endonuclease RelE of RelBE toxin-antitoxin system